MKVWEGCAYALCLHSRARVETSSPGDTSLCNRLLLYLEFGRLHWWLILHSGLLLPNLLPLLLARIVYIDDEFVTPTALRIDPATTLVYATIHRKLPLRVVLRIRDSGSNTLANHLLWVLAIWHAKQDLIWLSTAVLLVNIQLYVSGNKVLNMTRWRDLTSAHLVRVLKMQVSYRSRTSSTLLLHQTHVALFCIQVRGLLSHELRCLSRLARQVSLFFNRRFPRLLVIGSFFPARPYHELLVWTHFSICSNIWNFNLN